MQGITYITNSRNRRIAVQIELKTLRKFEEQIQDLLDGIIAEARKTEKSIPFEKVVKALKKKGKL